MLHRRSSSDTQEEVVSHSVAVSEVEETPEEREDSDSDSAA